MLLLTLVVMFVMPMLQVSVAVLSALVKWATPEGAAELMQRPGTLVSLAYEDEKDNDLMAKVIAPHATDEQVVDLLQCCCMNGIDHWKKHAGFGLDDNEARVVTDKDQMCLGHAPANNDACERIIASVRFWKTRAPSMRSSGAEAQVMAKLNDPFCALKEGRLGKVGEVLNMAKAMAITAIHEQGTALDELELRAKEQKDYHDLYGPKPSQGAAAITRRDNRAAAATAWH